MEIDIIFIDRIILGSFVVGLYIWVCMIQKRIAQLENLPSIKDFLKQAKNKKRKK